MKYYFWIILDTKFVGNKYLSRPLLPPFWSLSVTTASSFTSAMMDAALGTTSLLPSIKSDVVCSCSLFLVPNLGILHVWPVLMFSLIHLIDTILSFFFFLSLNLDSNSGNNYIPELFLCISSLAQIACSGSLSAQKWGVASHKRETAPHSCLTLTAFF